MILSKFGRFMWRSAVCALLLWSVQGCSDPASQIELPAAFIRIDIDKSEADRLLDYYFGGYITPEPHDPFEAGVLADTAGAVFVNIDSLNAHFASAASHLTDANGNNRIDWEELEAFVDATYYEARGLPLTLDSLLGAIDFSPDDPDWMQIELDGVMTTARRRLSIRESAVREALARYFPNGEQLLYPVGTTILGEHFIEGARAETTVMSKREDGYWDYAVYGSGDSLAPTTATPPRQLKSPVQCVGCHFGSKLFEPEKSFPSKAEPGPHGPRQVYVQDAIRDADVARMFDEHRKRSDTILGLYSTLFVAELRQQARDSTITQEDAALLENLGL